MALIAPPDDRKQFFADSVGANLSPEQRILSPLISNNWDQISRDSKEAWRYCIEEAIGGSFNIEPIPAVLERTILLPWPRKVNPQCLVPWYNAERFLASKGFTEGSFIYLASGREAVVCAIKNVPHVLLKISIFHPINRTPVVIDPTERRTFSNRDIPLEKQAVISIGLVIYLEKPFESRQPDNEKALGLKSIRVPQHLAEKYANLKVDVEVMKALLPKQGNEAVDVIPVNLRSLPCLPNMPFVIDRRAVNILERTQNGISLEQSDIVAAYKEVSHAVHLNIVRGYGFRDSIWTRISAMSRGEQVGTTLGM